MPMERLRLYFESPDLVRSADYSRYWHGYLLLLKPALALGFDISSIRVCKIAMQAVLIACIAILLLKERLLVPGLAFLFFLLSTHFETVFVSMQYSSVYILVYGAITYILLSKRHSLEKQCTLFVFVGALTNFFDLLTAPLLTLCIPLLFILFLSAKREKNPLSAQQVLKIALFWSLGYFGIWLMKWAVASIILNENIFSQAVSQAALRTSAHGSDSSENISILQVFASNTNPYISPILIGLVLVYFAFLLIEAKKQDHKPFRDLSLRRMIPFL